MRLRQRQRDGARETETGAREIETETERQRQRETETVTKRKVTVWVLTTSQPPTAWGLLRTEARKKDGVSERRRGINEKCRCLQFKIFF